jgi:hypothetical protein
MQDIRAGLKERLGAVAKERADLQARLTEVGDREIALKALLQQEESKFGKLEPRLPFNGAIKQRADSPVKGGTPLSRLILTAIQEAKKPLMLDDFKQAAQSRNFDFGTKAPGRVLHWALVGMEESNILERADNGGYQLKQVTQ